MRTTKMRLSVKKATSVSVKVALEILRHDQHTAIAKGKFVRFDFWIADPNYNNNIV